VLSEEATLKIFALIANLMLELPAVSHGHGKKGFGENALNVHGKIFAMLTPKRQFVVKLPKHRVLELLQSGHGVPFEMAGRQMKEWFVVKSNSKKLWRELAQEAHAFVGRSA
jgi:hypothetical protein